MMEVLYILLGLSGYFTAIAVAATLYVHLGECDEGCFGAVLLAACMWPLSLPPFVAWLITRKILHYFGY